MHWLDVGGILGGDPVLLKEDGKLSEKAHWKFRTFLILNKKNKNVFNDLNGHMVSVISVRH